MPEVAERNEAVRSAWQESNRHHLISARRARGATKEVEAYGSAMRSLQDDYYKHVGAPCGLLRDGPRRARKSTIQHAEDQRQANLLAQTQKEAEKKKNASLAVAKINASYQEQLEERERALDKRHTALQQRQAELEALHRSVELREMKVAASEVEISEGFSALSQIVNGLEKGTATVRNGRIYMPSLPSFITHIYAPQSPQTPITRMLKRFVSLIIRAGTTTGGRLTPERDTDEHPTPR